MQVRSMTTEPQRGGVGEPIAWMNDKGHVVSDRSKRRAEKYRKGFGQLSEAIDRYTIPLYLAAASPVKVESGEAVSDAELRAAWDVFWKYPRPTADSAALRAAIDTVLSTRRPDDRVNSGTDSGKVGGWVG